MKKVAAFIILAFLSFTTISAADTVPPASIHLELGKDTLALAEPTFLTVEIHNQSETDLPISDLFMFGLEESSPNWSLFLITPEGEEWEYMGRRYSVFATYSINDSLHLSCRSKDSAERISAGLTGLPTSIDFPYGFVDSHFALRSVCRCVRAS